MKKQTLLIITILLLTILLYSFKCIIDDKNRYSATNLDARIKQKADSVLALMTLKEKIGQMVQYNSGWDLTGPPSNMGDKEKLSFYNDKLEWTAESGDFEVMIGASSADIRLRSDFELIK